VGQEGVPLEEGYTAGFGEGGGVVLWATYVGYKGSVENWESSDVGRGQLGKKLSQQVEIVSWEM